MGERISGEKERKEKRMKNGIIVNCEGPEIKQKRREKGDHRFQW